MKKKILKPINNQDLLVVYRFFKANSETYTKIPITANELSKVLGYEKNDIINIICYINMQKRFKYVILGSNAGYYFINETNISLALKILDEREDKCCSELYSINEYKEKVESL